MSTIPGENPVCCTMPPAESDYKSRGTFETINGISTYVAGNKASKKVIIVAMDIFGMVPLTQRGCDLIASQGFYVLMPDFLGDQALVHGDLPSDDPEKIEKRMRLLSGVGNPQARAIDFAKFGYCWGAKVILLAGASDSFTAVAAVHPALIAPDEAANCKAVLGFYLSKDEDPVEMEPFIQVAKDYKLYSEAHHGFAAARAMLDDPQCKAAYDDVYQRLSAFFKKHLVLAKN